MSVSWTFDGSRIVDAREANDITVSELARRIHVAPHQVSSWEKGLVEPSQKNLTAICTALQCPPRFFFIANSDDDYHQVSQ